MTNPANPASLKQNTAWMLSGEVARLGIQAVYFIMMARNLGPGQYGAFVAVTAAAALVSPFVGLGAGNLMVKNVARDRNLFGECWGNSLFTVSISGLTLVAVVLGASLLLLPPSIPLSAMIFIVAAEVLLAPFVLVAVYAFQSMERMRWMASLNVFACFTRLLAIATIVALHQPTLMAWSVAYLVTAAVSAAAALTAVACQIGKPALCLRRIRTDFREGLYFSTGLSAQTIYNDIDKTMLARLSTLDAVGIYAAAYRLIDVAFIPVRSLMAAAYPGFFRSGKAGIAGSMAYGRRLMKKSVAYSIGIAAAMLLLAPLVPHILGNQYARTSEALRWLALLPLLKSIHYFGADSLTCAGYQWLRTLAQMAIAAFNVLINLWIIPAYSWRGAAWSSLASDGMLAVILWSCALFIARSEARIPLYAQTLAVGEGD